MNKPSTSQKPQLQTKPVVWARYPIERDAPCCNKAQKVFCVCRVSYQCPDHGTRCHGSHD